MKSAQPPRWRFRVTRRAVVLLTLMFLVTQWDAPTSWAQDREGPGEQQDEGSGNIVYGAAVIVGFAVAWASSDDGQEDLGNLWGEVEEGWDGFTDWVSDGWNGLVGDGESGGGGEPEPPDYEDLVEQSHEAVGDLGDDIGSHQKLDASEVVGADVSAPALAQEAVPVKQGDASNRELPEVTNDGLDSGSVQASTDPVALVRGEFIHRPVDLQVVGFGQALTLRRTYRSRVEFQGPLGPGWDHSLNFRLVEMEDSPTCATEVVVNLGDLAPLRFRPSLSVAQQLGQASVMFTPLSSDVRASLENRPQSTTCRWELRLADATRYCFDADGLGNFVSSPSDVRTVLDWESAGNDMRVAEATRRFAGDDTHSIEFEYESQQSTRLLGATLKQAGSVIEEVRYGYNARGELETVRDQRLDVLRERYDYSDDDEIEDDPPSKQGLSGYCSEFCAATSPDSCGGGSTYCQGKVEEVRADCPSLCADSCQSACDAEVNGPLRQQAVDECVKLRLEVESNASEWITRGGCEDEFDTNHADDLVEVCTESCVPSCIPECATGFSAADCSDACEDSCMALATESTYVYGRMNDLAHNLVTVTDGAGFKMNNRYGSDPRYPNFDAVTLQYFGDSPEIEGGNLPLPSVVDVESKVVQFDYFAFEQNATLSGLDFDVDLDWSTRPAVSPSGAALRAPDGLERICSAVNPLNPIFGDDRTLIPSGDRPVIYLVEPLREGLPAPGPEPLDVSDITLVTLEQDLLTRVDGLELGTDRTIDFGDYSAILTNSGSVTLDQFVGFAEVSARTVFNDFGVSQPSAADLATLNDFGLYATSSLKVNDRVKVRTATGEWAQVGSLGGQLNLGVEAVVGNILSTGPVTLRDRSRVEGSVVAPTVTRQNNVTVAGSIIKDTPPALSSPAFSLSFPAPDGGNVMLEPDRARGLPPGSYGNVSVKSRSQLALTAGVYFFRSLALEPDAVIAADTRLGPIYIYVKQSFTFRGAIQDASGRQDRLLVGYLGTGTASIERPFSGTLLAPNGTINLASVSTPHRGAFYGKSIEAHQGSEIVHVPFVEDWAPFAEPTDSATGDGEQVFPDPKPLKIPDALGVVSGNAGQGQAHLELTTDADVVVSCTFTGRAPVSHPVNGSAVIEGLLYHLEACDHGAAAGDVLSVSSVRLIVDSADALAPSGDIQVLARLPLVVEGFDNPLDALRTTNALSNGDLLSIGTVSGTLQVLGEVQAAAVITEGGCSRAFSLEFDPIENELVANPASACVPGTKIVPLLATADAADYWKALGGSTGTFFIGGGAAHEPSQLLGTGMTLDDWLAVTDAMHTVAGLQALQTTSTFTSQLEPSRSSADVAAVLEQLTLRAQATPGSEELLAQLDQLRLTLAEGYLNEDREGPVVASIPEHLDPIVIRDYGDELSLLSDFIPIMTELGLPSYWLDESRPHLLEEFPCPSSEQIREPHLAFAPVGSMTTRFATVVSGPGRETIVSYYNMLGDNIRVANFDRFSVDTFEYDAMHNQTGSLKHTFDSLDAVEPRICSSYDSRGLVRTITRSSTDYSEHQTTCVSHDETGPWITRVTEAGNASRVAFSAAYSSAGNPELMLDANSLATRFGYDAEDRLESRTDSNGSVTTFDDYDPDLQFPRTVTQDAEGEARDTELGYSDWGQLSVIRRFSWGPTQVWNYDERTRLRRYLVSGDEGSFESIFNYLDNGLVDHISDAEGVTSFEYDRARDLRIMRRTSDNAEQVSCLFFRPDGNLGSSVDPQGARRRTEFVYAQQGAAHSATLTTFVDSDPVDGCATRASGTYSDVDGVLSVVRQDHALRALDVSDGAGNFETRTYDEWGRLATRVFGEGETRRSVGRYYDSRDRLIAEIETVGAGDDPPSTLPDAGDLDQVDGFARAAFFSYDRAGRPKSNSLFAGAPGRPPGKVSATTFTYQDAARRVVIEQETPGGSREVVAEYDGLMRPTDISTNFGYSASISYPTSLESIVETQTPDGRPLVTETQYNRSGLPTLVKVNGVEIESLGYDTLSRVTSAVQGDVETAISYAPFGGTQSLVKRRAGSGAALENIEFNYDDRGRLMHVLTGDDEVVEYRYDVLGRVREERRTSADNPSNTANWERTFVGTSHQVDRLELPSGRALEYHYADGRPVIEAIVATAANVANLEGAQTIRFDYDHDGLSTEATVREDGSAVSSLTAQVDGIGRRTSEETSLSGRTHNVERDWSVGVGMTGLTVNGRHFRYDRLSDGRLDRVLSGNDVLVDNDFEGDGEPVSVTYGNGLAEARSFDDLGRTLHQDLPGFSLSFGYGTDHALRRVTTQVGGTDDRSSLFETDAVGRIGAEHLGVPLASTLASGTITNESIQVYESQAESSRVFSYDTANNWTNVTSTVEPSWSPSPNAANVYTQTPSGPADYDADGRLISDGEREYGYDAFGRLARVTGPGIECTYQYDAEGRRTEATCNGATVQFGYDGADVVAIYDQAGTKLALREVALAAPFALLSENETTYLLVGASRSVYAAFDDSGELIENYEYSAFGETTTHQVGAQASGNPFKFHGHLELALTGMFDMRARAYSPKLGRFLAPDPLGPHQSPNLYAMVENRPHERWDPMGLSSAPATQDLLGEFVVTGCGSSFECEELPPGIFEPGMYDGYFSAGGPQPRVFPGYAGGFNPGTSSWVNLYNPTGGAYYATAGGGSQWGGGGLPWYGPGGQPFRFYMGNQAHIAIGARYVELNPQSVYDWRLDEVATAFGQMGFPVSEMRLADAGLRPDIVNFATAEVYEIKPLGNESQGLQELEMYMAALGDANIPVIPGRMGAPGTYGVVTSPDGGVFRYGTVTPGVIVYQPLNLPIPIPVNVTADEQQRFGAPEVLGAGATVGAAYLSYKVARAIVIGFGMTPVAGAASLAVP